MRLPGRPAPRRDAVTLPRLAPQLRPKRSRLRLRWRRYAVLVVAMYCAVVGHRELVAVRQAQAQLRMLRAREAALRAEQSQLRARIAYAQGDAYVAAAAREEFGLVAPDEVPLSPVDSPTPPRRIHQ